MCIRDRYKAVCLELGPHILYLEAGSQTDGRVTAQSALPDGSRIFETKCTDRQASQWLLDIADGHYAPDFTQWKDITKQLRK